MGYCGTLGMYKNRIEFYCIIDTLESQQYEPKIEPEEQILCDWAWSAGCRPTSAQ